MTDIVAQPSMQQGSTLLTVEYSKISSEVLRADGALAGEMRRDNARENSGELRELELSPGSQIHESIQELRRQSIVNNWQITEFVSHLTDSLPG